MEAAGTMYVSAAIRLLNLKANFRTEMISMDFSMSIQYGQGSTNKVYL